MLNQEFVHPTGHKDFVERRSVTEPSRQLYGVTPGSEITVPSLAQRAAGIAADEDHAPVNAHGEVDLDPLQFGKAGGMATELGGAAHAKFEVLARAALQSPNHQETIRILADDAAPILPNQHSDALEKRVVQAQKTLFANTLSEIGETRDLNSQDINLAALALG